MSIKQFIGGRTIYGADGEHWTPYLTQFRIGRLHLHIFHRGDADPDAHDHPWDFWTFPLVSYVEEVWDAERREKSYRRVERFRLHARNAEFTHRVIGRAAKVVSPADSELLGEWATEPGKIITIVWKGPDRRKWGFWKDRGSWCWTPWRTYAFGGGKHTGCENEGEAAE
ncbi:hypothetical protein [Allomesorhizobium alhagi]|uniref:Uncharacterized protein n=1 Tax=Mesorhizobium alhagi CCNWXJ12-2 TaxID=1107882 RepID=H0HQV8_9HYPH|nr:hypothetical protein [Mesorhizobium alhagi]EHK56922.1 hypothetical protein MAXJ12_12692 [Mesorhizobium alhagi CCNWXJ12-2]